MLWGKSAYKSCCVVMELPHYAEGATGSALLWAAAGGPKHPHHQPVQAACARAVSLPQNLTLGLFGMAQHHHSPMYP